MLPSSIKEETSFPSSTFKLSNMDCIIDPKDGVGGLYLGNLRGAQDIITLISSGVNAVLTVAAGTRLRFDPELMPNHSIIPAEDHEDYDLAKSFEEGIEFINEYIKTGNVYVHCFAGVSRSATMVSAYLIKELNMEFGAALKLVKQKRWVADPNEGFVKQLADFEKKLKLKPSTDTSDDADAKTLKSEEVI